MDQSGEVLLLDHDRYADAVYVDGLATCKSYHTLACKKTPIDLSDGLTRNVPQI